MASSTVKDQPRAKEKKAISPSNRPGKHGIAATVGEAVHQEHQAGGNREAVRRQAASAFRESIAQNRSSDRQNMQAGVEKMVRAVVSKESDQASPDRIQQRARQDIQACNQREAQAQYIRQKLNSAYNTSTSDTSRDQVLRPSPSQLNQKIAVEDYQQSTRNSIDRTVKIVV